MASMQLHLRAVGIGCFTLCHAPVQCLVEVETSSLYPGLDLNFSLYAYLCRKRRGLLTTTLSQTPSQMATSL